MKSNKFVNGWYFNKPLKLEIIAARHKASSYTNLNEVTCMQGIIAARRAATLILTRSRGYICVRNLDFFHLVGNDLRYNALTTGQRKASVYA